MKGFNVLGFTVYILVIGVVLVVGSVWRSLTSRLFSSHHHEVGHFPECSKSGFTAPWLHLLVDTATTNVDRPGLCELAAWCLKHFGRMWLK